MDSMNGAIVILALATGSSCHGIEEPPECTMICQKLTDCHFLPSVLGATGDGPSAQYNCESRCRISSSENAAYQHIHDCWHDNAQCLDFGQCLRAQFPETPITGLSDVQIEAVVQSANGAVAMPEAMTTGAMPVASLRTFVTTWGTQRLSKDIAYVASARISTRFANVPAEPSVRMGVQVSVGNCCHEYSRLQDVGAGVLDATAPFDLPDPAIECAMPASDGGTDCSPGAE